MLTRIDRIQIARFMLEKRFGNLVSMYSGPIVWIPDPDEALAQLILLVARANEGQIAKDRAAIEIAARVLEATGYLKGKESPLPWAQKTQLASGNLEPDLLSRGIGESLGLLKWVYKTAKSTAPTDLDCIALADALDTIKGEEDVYPIWTKAKTPWAKRSFAVMTLIGMKDVGVYRVMDAVDCGKFTPWVAERLAEEPLPYSDIATKAIHQIFT